MYSILRKIAAGPRSLVGRLTLFSVAVVLVGYVALTAIVLDLLKQEITTLSAADQLAIANYAAEDVGGRVRSRLALVRRIATGLPTPLLESPERLRAWLQDREQGFGLFTQGLMVVPLDGKGTIADFPPRPDRQHVDYGDTRWFASVAEGRRPVIGKPDRDPANGAPRITMAAPIFGPDGKPKAILAGVTELDTPGFLERLNHTKIGETGGFLLISPDDGLFVASTKPEMVLAPLPRPGMNKLHDQAMNGLRGTGITTNAFGVEELSAMASVPGTNWFLVARMPTAEAFQAVGHARALILRGSLLISLALAAILLVALPRLFRPLSRAARDMRQMADGTVALHKLAVTRKDEIGEVISGFNFLLERVQQDEARMAHMAHHDALTGLPNRAMFLDRLEQACSRAQRSKQSVAVMFIDLDGFKPINDSHGHEIGDEALRQVAQRLSKAVRRTDTIARFGGDEFVVILSDLNDPRRNVAAMAENFREAFATPFAVGSLSLTLGLSIGSAVYPDDGKDPDMLLSHADRAMYAAKKAARPVIPVAAEGLS